MAVGLYSTIPLVIEQLLVTLNARKDAAPAGTGLDGVLIEDGVPMEVPEDRERVYIDDPVNVVREWAQLGRFAIDESYTMKIPVEVFQEGNDRAACRRRFFEIVAEVELAAVLDVTLAGVLNWGVKPGPMDPKCRPTGDGWLAFATVSLECSGRIRAS